MEKILIVDDDPDMIALIRTILKDRYNLMTAGDGKAALEMVRREKPDLILTDVLMPIMSGYDFYKSLRSLKSEVGDIPLMVMSSRHSMQDFFDIWSIASFLKKPFQPEELLTGVEEALKRTVGGAAPVKSAAPAQAEVSQANSVVPSASASKKQRLALIASPDPDVVMILSKFLSFKNFAVQKTADTAELCEIAQKKLPYIIICQFWKDAAILNAHAAREKLAGIQQTYKIPFVPVCAAGLSAEAQKIFGQGDVVVFESMRELREKLDAYL